jgi:O-6-methylguanine DNA methyltransferase
MATPTDFEEKVLRALKKIPRGKITTYNALARAVGHPRAARAVGNALKKNPNLIKCSCHRVVKSDGRVGGYARGEKKKIQILRKEGIKIKDGEVVDFEKALFRF